MSMYAVITFVDGKTPTINARAKTVQDAIKALDDLVETWVMNFKATKKVEEVTTITQKNGQQVFVTVSTDREVHEAIFYVARDMCNE